METQDQNKMNEWQERHYRNHSPAGRVLGGLVLVGIGAVLFMEKMGIVFPDWLFSWKMLLIAIGIYVGARHTFRGFGWLIPILIGLLFLADDFIPGFAIRPFIWPIVIVVIGLFMIFRPKRKYRWDGDWQRHAHKWQHRDKYSEASSSEDRLETVVVFGSTKKNVITKDFKGGDVTCVFGGAEINLSQADINGKVILELTQVFGGTKLVIPPHWQIQTEETVTFMGNIEDRRPDTKNVDPTKILVIRGSSVFGAIHISSY